MLRSLHDNAAEQPGWSGLAKSLFVYRSSWLVAAQPEHYVAEMRKNHSLNLVPNLELLLFYQEGWQIRVFCYDS